MRADIWHIDIKGGDAGLVLPPQEEKGNLEMRYEAGDIVEMVRMIE